MPCGPQPRLLALSFLLVLIVAWHFAAPLSAQNPIASATEQAASVSTEDSAAEEGSRGAASAEEEPGIFDGPILSEEGLFDPNYWASLGQRFLTEAIEYLPRLLASLILFGLFWFLSRLVGNVLRRGLSRSNADPAVRTIVIKLVTISIIVLGTLMAFSQAGLPVGSLLASVGVLGLAVGLAAQESLSNIVAGLIILWSRPFRVGDRVTIASEYGTVSEVDLRTTTITTVRKLEAILPNNQVISSKIINHSRTPELRIDVPVGIGYAEDIDAARKTLLVALEDCEYVSQQRDSAVVVRSLGDSSVNLELRVWLERPSDERPATWALTELAKKALDNAGIEIPFPQRTLHLADGEQALSIRTQTGEKESSASN